MQINPVVLMVSGQAAHFDSLLRAISETGCKCEPRRAHNSAIALARVAGGGVKLVLLDVSGWRTSPAKMDNALKFPVEAPGLPFAFWSDCDDTGLPAIAAQAGAAGCITSGNAVPELTRILSGMIGKEPALTAAGRLPPALATSTVIAVMGVKGGVGASTVAMNVAAALAGHGSVILAEIRPVFGDLQSHFHPGRMVRGFSSRRTIDLADTARSMLWPVPGVPGLRVLFGPQAADDCGEIDAPQATRWLQALAAEADFVVVDLPFSLSPANCGILGESHYLALVIEPTPGCLRLAGLILEGIRNWEKTPAAVGTVVVRSTFNGAPVAISDIEARLGVPMFQAVPPAAVSCLQAERTHVPLIQCDPDSLVSAGFNTLAGCFLPGKRLKK